MRVLVVTSRPPWVAGDGDSLILRHHLDVLARHHEITLLCAARSSSGARPPAAVPTEVFTGALPPALDHLVRRARSSSSGEPAAVHWVERPALLAELDRRVATDAVDLLHLFGWGTAQLWQRAGGLPAVHFAVDPWAEGVGNRRLPAWRRLAERGTHRRVAAHEACHYPRLSSVVVVTGEDAERLAARAPGAALRVVSNGVDPGPEPSPPPAGPVLAFHGGFGVEANVAAAQVFAREVVPAVRARVPDVQALVIGRDPPRSVRRLAGPVVTVTGAVASVREWLERCAVYVAPMTTGSGVKNKVLEAMAAGRPVVATPLALQGIGTGEGVVVAADARAIADRVVSLLADRVALADGGRGARSRAVAEFSWEASARRLEAVWDEARSAGVPAPA